MPLASSGGNGRQSTPSAPASVLASVSSPSLPAAANAAGAASAADASSASSATIANARPSSSTAAPSSSSSSSSRPSFLSRLGIPLTLPRRGRNRNIADFHVRCDEPHKKYSAGEHVHGAIVLVVVKPLRYTHLVVTLHGFVRVLRDPAAVAKVQSTTTLPQGGSSSRPQYHGNGFASLFQDEQVLSGEGRLNPGRYEFKFDLLFPDKGLPSSIDFERGTISYMVTGVLTKPTSMASTATCERKVLLSERIDVGLIPPPQPRPIFLEPISKRTKKKKPTMVHNKGTAAASGAAATETTNDLASEADSAESTVITENSAQDHQPTAEHRGPSSNDVQSEFSGESNRSISTAMSLPQLSQVGTAYTSAQQQAVNDKTIKASIELLRGGCLPGDTISVRVAVQHVKPVKSITGIIVTLFRQGKIDSSPPSQLFKNMMTKEDARRFQKEDIYPKSRTGLGGLSLSSASSISIFRKDLDQTTAPLIIDPATLQTSVTVPVKLPDDSFSTIKGVPGDMISFKYQVEVIVDLGGRLSGQVPSGQKARFGPFSNSSADSSMNMFSQRRDANFEIFDTTQLRRQKGVISITMESIVGTVDTSGGRKAARDLSSSRTLELTESDDEEGFISTPTRYEEARLNSSHANGFLPQGYIPPQQPNNQHIYASLPPPSHHPHRSDPLQPSYSRNNAHRLVPLYEPPPPQLPDQHSLSEKERIRQAEQRLLPSQPPPAGPAGPAGPSSPDDEDIYDAQATPRAPQIGSSGEEAQLVPSAPTEEELTAAVINAAAAPGGEDKQELERRRLMQEASAPPEFPEDMVRRNGEGRAPRQDDMVPDAEPTAPVLDEDDAQNYGRASGAPAIAAAGSSSSGGRDGDLGQHHPHDEDGEQLPAYRR